MSAEPEQSAQSISGFTFGILSAVGEIALGCSTFGECRVMSCRPQRTTVPRLDFLFIEADAEHTPQPIIQVS